MSDQTWTTRQGETIAYEDLETGHLCSIIGMLERNAARAIEKYDKESGGLDGYLTEVDIYPKLVSLRAEMSARLAMLEAEKEAIEAEKAAIDDEVSESAKRFALLELD